MICYWLARLPCNNCEVGLLGPHGAFTAWCLLRVCIRVAITLACMQMWQSDWRTLVVEVAHVVVEVAVGAVVEEAEAEVMREPLVARMTSAKCASYTSGLCGHIRMCE